MLILSVFCYIIRAINYVFVVLKVMLYMSDRLIDNKELMKEWNQEKNILYNPADLTSGSSKKVWWKCKNGHEWEAVIHTRVKGVGCPYCMGKKAIQGVNDFATLYPEMLKEWDYEENDKLGIKPNELLVGSIKKVYWICSKGHKYDRSIYDRLHGRGNCPYCGNRKVLQGYNDLATTNPELLKDWDYEENDKLGIKPNEITNGGKEKVWWKCGNGYVVGVGKVRKDGTRRLSWRCHTAVLYGKKHIVDNHEMGCDNQRVGDETLKECFFKIMSKLKINQKEVEKRVISELKISMDKCNDNMVDVNLLENAQNKLEREKSRLLDLYLGEFISKEDFNIKNNELIDKINKNTKELKNLQLKQNLQQDLDEIFKKIVDRIKYILSFKEYNNNVIEELIDKVVIDDKQHFKYYIKGIQDPIFATEMGVISSQPH